MCMRMTHAHAQKSQSCHVLLVQPSSVAAERVFSLLNNAFHSQQESSLEDYLELSVMLQYNYRKGL